MPQRFKNGDAVFVEWADSCCASGWKNDDELAAINESLCASIGWVLRLTKRAVVIAPHLGINDGVALNQTNGHMIIPLSAIRRVRKLPLPTLAQLRA